MPLSRNVLERQIAQAKSELSAWVDSLTKSGVSRPDFRKNPKWRTLNAKCNQVQRRLSSLATTETREADIARKKAEGEAAAS